MVAMVGFPNVLCKLRMGVQVAWCYAWLKQHDIICVGGRAALIPREQLCNSFRFREADLLHLRTTAGDLGAFVDHSIFRNHCNPQHLTQHL